MNRKMAFNKNKMLGPLNTLAFIMPAAFVFMWSSGAIFVKFGLHYADPFIFLFLRLFISSFILWGIVFYLKTPLSYHAKEWGYTLLTGMFMQAGYQIFFFMALAYSISPGILTIILGAQPILTAILTKERKQLLQWIGLILGMTGLILVVSDSLFIKAVSLIGIICAGLSLLGITIGTIMQKRIRMNQPLNMAIQYTGSAVVLFFLVLLFKPSLHWTIMFVISLSWMVLIVSVGATVLLYLMIQKDSLTNVASLFYCVSPVTSLLDFFIFGSTLKWLAVAGMILIIIGLILVNRKRTAASK
ncbi:drug/metabolite transporter (DMT)-like permease [Scopulibacillus daqui]|uniref:Drug/metabolite transporter (DMT)-like permease n=1 Tax=Scopulibacillus daqui TaxID=1469162 RepID=A0ABS2Q5K6_9BACL|nr:DMT family transporter [Scopulibacillus daqui]MBM7646777.1 drug/metabolite transporter (DMT)-like permease [Scopulibacillus daqui]